MRGNRGRPVPGHRRPFRRRVCAERARPAGGGGPAQI